MLAGTRLPREALEPPSMEIPSPGRLDHLRGASNPTGTLLGCLQRDKAKVFGARYPLSAFLQ